MNPYEPPQTIGQPLPMAAEIVVIPPEDAILSIATGHCAKGGRLSLLGMASAWVLILPPVFGVGQSFAARDNPLLIITAIFLGVTSFVFFAWGFLQSLVGYLQLRVKTQEPRLRRVYSLIVLQLWLKALLVLMVLFMPERPFTWWRLVDWFRLLPHLGLVLSFADTCYLHFRGLRLLAERGQFTPPLAAVVYLITGGLLLPWIVATAIYLELPYGELWLVATGLLVTLHIGAYATGYKLVHDRFRARSERA